MAINSSAHTLQNQALEDPLAYMPRSRLLEYKKNQVIYDYHEPSTNIYLVIEGGVKVTCNSVRGPVTIIDIYQADEFFCPSAFVGSLHRSEQAISVENTRVMAWTGEEIEHLLIDQPWLGVALTQVFAQRAKVLSRRIQSLALDNVSRRLADALYDFAERVRDPPAEDGSISMKMLPHELLSQYVGTSREIITYRLNQFRRLGYLRYTRKEIVLYPAFRNWLEQDSPVEDTHSSGADSTPPMSSTSTQRSFFDHWLNKQGISQEPLAPNGPEAQRSEPLGSVTLTPEKESLLEGWLTRRAALPKSTTSPEVSGRRGSRSRSSKWNDDSWFEESYGDPDYYTRIKGLS